MNRDNNLRIRGFTVVELTLAMTFISVLLLVIAMTVIQIGSIYNKGMTFRAVDQAGRVIVADIRTTIGQAEEPFDVDRKFVVQKNTGSSHGESEGGRLCTGEYSYIWNYGRSIAKDLQVNRYDGGGDQVGFVRVRDGVGKYCSRDSHNKLEEVTIDKDDDPIELLSGSGGSDVTVAVHSLKIVQISSNFDSSQGLYSIELEIGTNEQDAIGLVNPSGSLSSISCKPPKEAGANQDFCAVNKFEFTALTGSGGSI